MYISIGLGEKQRRKNSIKQLRSLANLPVNLPALTSFRSLFPNENVLRFQVGPSFGDRRENSIPGDSSRLTLVVAAPRSIYEDYRPLIAVHNPCTGGANERGPIRQAINAFPTRRRRFNGGRNRKGTVVKVSLWRCHIDHFNTSFLFIWIILFC